MSDCGRRGGLSFPCGSRCDCPEGLSRGRGRGRGRKFPPRPRGTQPSRGAQVGRARAAASPAKFGGRAGPVGRQGRGGAGRRECPGAGWGWGGGGGGPGPQVPHFRAADPWAQQPHPCRRAPSLRGGQGGGSWGVDLSQGGGWPPPPYQALWGAPQVSGGDGWTIFPPVAGGGSRRWVPPLPPRGGASHYSPATSCLQHRERLAGSGVRARTLGVWATEEPRARTQSRVGTRVQMNVLLGVCGCMLLSGGVFCSRTSMRGVGGGAARAPSGVPVGSIAAKTDPGQAPHPQGTDLKREHGRSRTSGVQGPGGEVGWVSAPGGTAVWLPGLGDRWPQHSRLCLPSTCAHLSSVSRGGFGGQGWAHLCTHHRVHEGLLLLGEPSSLLPPSHFSQSPSPPRCGRADHPGSVRLPHPPQPAGCRADPPPKGSFGWAALSTPLAVPTPGVPTLCFGGSGRDCLLCAEPEGW